MINAVAARDGGAAPSTLFCRLVIIRLRGALTGFVNICVPIAPKCHALGNAVKLQTQNSSETMLKFQSLVTIRRILMSVSFE